MLFVQMIPRLHALVFLAQILRQQRVALQAHPQRLAAIGNNRKQLALIFGLFPTLYTLVPSPKGKSSHVRGKLSK